MTAWLSVEEEFDRFAADLLGERRPVVGSRGPLPSITAQFIYEYGLELVDCEGIDALTVRRLAADLKISTRTLYKRIGSRTRMIRELIALHLSRLDLDVHPAGTWEDTIWAWCLQLHQALTARPHLTAMSQGWTLAVVASHVDTLIEATARGGVSKDVAAECCWSVADVTINDAVGAAHEMTRQNAPRTVGSSVEPSKTAADAIKWILRGVAAGAESPAKEWSMS